jgi:hypothetical protein
MIELDVILLDVSRKWYVFLKTLLWLLVKDIENI